VILNVSLYMTSLVSWMRASLVFAAALLLAGALSVASAQDGKAIYTSKGCPACHGPDGGKPLGPGYPSTKGQDQTYIINQLKAFKSGERKGGQSALMAPMAQTLNDSEAAAIAKFLSTAK
jgi:cytochrome c